MVEMPFRPGANGRNDQKHPHRMLGRGVIFMIGSCLTIDEYVYIFIYLYVFIHIYLSIYIYMVTPPQDLPQSFFNNIYIYIYIYTCS